MNDVNGKLETEVASTDSSSTDSGNETAPSSSSLPPARNSTPDSNKGNKASKTSEDKEKNTQASIEISSSIQVLDSDEEEEVQKNRENVKRNIRRVLAETDGVVTIDDSDDDHSSNENSDCNKMPKSKNNNHKSDSNHLDDLLDTDQENDPTDEENDLESDQEPEKSVPKKKRNEIRSFVKSGYDLVKSRSRKKSSDAASSSRNKKQKPTTKTVPVTIIPPPTPPGVDEGTPPRQDEQGNFVVKKILKTRVSSIQLGPFSVFPVFGPDFAYGSKEMTIGKTHSTLYEYKIMI